MTDSTITIDFAVPTHYTIGPRFADWQSAVDEARTTITRIEYKGQVVRKDAPDYEPRRMVQEDDVLVHYTRAFVHMRAITRAPNGGSTDGVLMTWEVFRDSVVKMQDYRDMPPGPERTAAKTEAFRQAYSGRGVTGYPFEGYDGSDESFERLQDLGPKHVHPESMPCNVMCPANPNTVKRG